MCARPERDHVFRAAPVFGQGPATPIFLGHPALDPHRGRCWLTSRSPLFAGIELPAMGIRHLPGGISQALRGLGCPGLRSWTMNT